MLLGGTVVLHLFLVTGIFAGGFSGFLLSRLRGVVPPLISALTARVPVLALALTRALVPVPAVMAPPLSSLMLALLRLLGLGSR